MPTGALKKRLATEGFEIFRVQGPRVHLADRVRDNLIMDSGVAAVVDDAGFRVRLTVRAQASLFPGEGPKELYNRARHLAKHGISTGYAEVEAEAVPVRDPGGGAGTLDTWYEVAFEKPVASEDLVEELRYALGLEKTVGTG